MDAFFNLLQIEKDEFLFQFQSHPNYPTLLAFSDTLNFLGFKNDAYELEREYWNELPDEFIAIYKGDFVLVRKENNNHYIYRDDVKNISERDLLENSEDFVLLLEKEEVIKKNVSINFRKSLFFVLFLYIAYSFYFLSWFESIFNLFSLLGFYLSYEVFNQKFGQSAPVLNNICGGEKLKTNVKTGCNKVMDSDKVDIYGLKLSDISLIYFASISILGLFIPKINFSLGIIAFLALSAVIYSLYFQIFIEKTLCKICLLIILTLACQAIISKFYFINETYYLSGLGLDLIIFIIITILIINVNLNFNTIKELKNSNIRNLRFKRDFEIFKRELLAKDKVHFSKDEIFYLGKKNAKLHISILSNPNCGFCKDAHELLEKIREKYSNDVSIQFRFNYIQESADDQVKTLMSHFLSAYKYGKENDFINLTQEWFKNKDILRIKKYGDINESEILKLHEIGIENRDLGFNFTPILFFNGYQFPEKYDIEDIYYFIDDLLEDSDLININDNYELITDA